MNWLNLSVSVARSPEFIGAEPTQRSTWFSLLAYCAEQENGGVIRDCKSWKDRRWQQTAVVTDGEALDACDLFWFEGEDLHVAFYPHSKEKQVQDGRTGGKLGGRGKKKVDDTPSENPSQNPSPPKGLAPPKPEEKIREEKVREEREKKPPAAEGGALAAEVMEFVNCLRTSWTEVCGWTADEVAMGNRNRACLESISVQTWENMRRWLLHRKSNGDGRWQPRSRLKFLEAPGDLAEVANSWARANPPRVPKLVVLPDTTEAMGADEVAELLKIRR